MNITELKIELLEIRRKLRHAKTLGEQNELFFAMHEIQKSLIELLEEEVKKVA